METKRVTRYISDCGKGFWKKSRCATHEENCKCWTNPKFKTCKTCKHGENVHDSNGMEDEPSQLHEWRQWECRNNEFDYDKHFTAAHKKAADLCINCPIWEG